MLRREALRLLAGAAAVPALAGLAPTRLLALGQRLHGAGRVPGAQPGDVLDAHQMRTVMLAAERIIPATDTPGAAAAGVHTFIDRLLAEWYDAEDRDRFLAGLADLDARARSRHGRDFADLDEAAQAALLLELDEELARHAAAGRPRGTHFFGQLKWLVVFGYYTSEVGVKEELKSVVIPGEYDPCRELGPAKATGGT